MDKQSIFNQLTNNCMRENYETLTQKLQLQLHIY